MNKRNEDRDALAAAAPQAERCVACGEDEPYTGACGSSDPRALCKRAAPQGDEPNIGVGVDVTTEGTHVTVAHRAGAVDRIIYSEFHAAPPALTQPVDRPDWMAEVCNAAATAMEANGLANRTEQLRNVARQLAAMKPAPSSGEGANNG